MNKVLVFINPTSRQGAERAEEAIAWLETNGFEILNLGFDHARDDMADWIHRHAILNPVVTIGGGDGSVNHALPLLLKTRLPLLLLPLGTANNLARTLQIPSVMSEALELLKHGRIDAIDVGLAKQIPIEKYQQKHAGEAIEVPFVNVLGVGMSARVNRIVPSEQKRWLGVFAFAWTLFRVAKRMTPFRVWVDCDGEKHFSRSWQVTVCNGRNYGSGLTIDAEATLHDQTLHGVSVEIGKWWHGFGLIPSFQAGHFVTTRQVKTFSGRSIKISTRHSKHVDIDGDIKARTPIEVSVLPKALKIYVPLISAHQGSTK